MENIKPSMEDIINFIESAMDSKYIIDVFSTVFCGVEVERDPYKIIQFRMLSRNGNTLEVITNDRGYFTIDNLSELDIANFRLIVEKCKKYKEEVGIRNYNNFFV